MAATHDQQTATTRPRNIGDVLARLSDVKPVGQGEWRAACPCGGHDTPARHLSVRDAGDLALVTCHPGPHDYSAICDALGCESLSYSSSASGTSERAKRSVATRYLVRDIEGQLVAVHVRRDTADAKKMHWEKPDGTRGLGGRSVASLPLYGSERLADLPDGADVVVVEGEKAAQALIDAGIPAVGTVTGAGRTPDISVLRPLVRLTPLLWADNDEKGYPHMDRIAARLFGLGVTPRMVVWPEAPPKGDAADAIAQGVDVPKLLAEAGEWESPSVVDLNLLLEDVQGFIRRFVATGEVQLAALTVWTAHTWVMDAAECTPYLHITSPEKQSGKTRLLETLAELGSDPWLTARASAAVLVRRVARDAPTLLLDETDSAFKADKEYSEALRGILNAGYRRGGAASLCVKKGADFDLVDFPVSCPKALAGIGELPDTIADRSIRISLKRRAPSESVERFRLRDVKTQVKPIKERLEAWARAAIGSLQDARPELPDGLSDRQADVWEPLLAIADLAGSPWPERVREAALVLSTGSTDNDLSLGVRLLHDVRLVLGQRTGPVTSAELVNGLVALEEAPWGDLRGKPLDARRLSRLLRPYDIRSKQFRIGDAVLRGYHPAEFRDAFERYCHTPGSSATSATSATETEGEVSSDREGVADVAGVAVPGGIQRQGELTEERPGDSDVGEV